MMYLARSFICKINDSGLLSRVQRYVKSAYGGHDKTKKENDLLEQALPTENIPGPRATFLFGNWIRFVPHIGEYGTYDMAGNTNAQLRELRDRYGDIVKLDGLRNGQAYILLFSSELCEKMYRMESMWSTRISIESLRYYCTNEENIYALAHLRSKQNDLLLASQGTIWRDFRSKDDSYMLEPQIIKTHITQINDITDEFMQKMQQLRQLRRMTWEMPEDFRDELYKWSLESTCSIALDCRLGCLESILAGNSEPQIMINCMHDLSDVMYRMNILPSLWKKYNTQNFMKWFRVVDTVNRIATKYIDQAEAKLRETTRDDDTNLHDRSILEKLLRLDKLTAHIMALEILMSGIDTIGNVAGAMLYYIASNPHKQNILFVELLSALPDTTTPITYEILNRMRYTKACIKETLRMFPITVNNIKNMYTDVCIGGYKIPAGFDVVACHSVIPTEPKQFLQPHKYIPERWLRDDTDFPSAKQAHSYEFMPVGFGSGSCLIQRFAMMQLEILLIKVIRTFWIEWHHGSLQLDSQFSNRIASPMQFRIL